jgi:hypothetical protein
MISATVSGVPTIGKVSCIASCLAISRSVMSFFACVYCSSLPIIPFTGRSGGSGLSRSYGDMSMPSVADR